MLIRMENIIHSLEEPIVKSSLVVARQVFENATSTGTSATAFAKPTCGGGGLDPDAEFNIPLHIGALFVILLTSTTGAFFPILAKRIPALKIPNIAFIIAKFFGSGVIIATAFIHMLPSAFASLSDPCLPDFWISTYTAAPGAIAMAAAIAIFLVDYGSTRYLAKVDQRVIHNTSTVFEPGHLTHSSPPPDKLPLDVEAASTPNASEERLALESGNAGRGEEQRAHFGHHHIIPPPVEGEEIDAHTAATQKLGVLILEAGIIFHSMFIGLTLAVSAGSTFISLFITIIFHQTFEGLALGSRIATLSFHKKDWRPYGMALAYACTTPLGNAIGLGIRLTYDPNSQTALITAGVFDAVSSGLLIYAGMVELLAHDFIHGEMRTAGNKLVVLAIGSMLVGCALMALLGKWA